VSCTLIILTCIYLSVVSRLRSCLPYFKTFLSLLCLSFPALSPAPVSPARSRRYRILDTLLYLTLHSILTPHSTFYSTLYIIFYTLLSYTTLLYLTHTTLLYLILHHSTLPTLTLTCSTLSYTTLLYLHSLYSALLCSTLLYLILHHSTLPTLTLLYFTLPYSALLYSTVGILFRFSEKVAGGLYSDLLLLLFVSWLATILYYTIYTISTMA
jgi:hypothetical protein